ncbi:MAG: response regulator [Pseudomonadota bacterium]|nr:response regulator [Pseudomonadota bacterium]
MLSDKKKILVVEDCDSDVSLLKHMLGSAGGIKEMDIASVSRLIDAFQRIDEERFDVILLDLNLIDMDGVASVSALAAEAPHLPIIVYSGMEDRRIKEEALLCGASQYLVKGHEDGHSLRHAINLASGRYPAMQERSAV